MIREISPFDDEPVLGYPCVSSTQSPSPTENRQLSLFELFALMTFVAIGIGVFLYVSSLLALLAGGSLIYLAVIRMSGCRNMLAGGFVGFLTATVVTFIVVKVGNVDSLVSIPLAILCPSAGYVFGAISAELGDDSL